MPLPKDEFASQKWLFFGAAAMPKRKVYSMRLYCRASAISGMPSHRGLTRGDRVEPGPIDRLRSVTPSDIRRSTNASHPGGERPARPLGKARGEEAQG